MRIRTISTGQLRCMGDQEGLILQGCGDDPQEWVDGINEIFAKEGILKSMKRNKIASAPQKSRLIHI